MKTELETHIGTIDLKMYTKFGSHMTCTFPIVSH